MGSSCSISMFFWTMEYGLWSLFLFLMWKSIEGKNSIPKDFLRRQAHKSTPVRYLDMFKEPWESISGLPSWGKCSPSSVSHSLPHIWAFIDRLISFSFFIFGQTHIDCHYHYPHAKGIHSQKDSQLLFNFSFSNKLD